MQEEYFMKHALKEANKAYQKDEVPIGCIILKDNKLNGNLYKNLKNRSLK